MGGQIQQSAGSPHDNLGASLDLFDLTLIGFAAINRHHRGGAILRRQLHILGHLDREFAGGNDNERLDALLGVGA